MGGGGYCLIYMLQSIAMKYIWYIYAYMIPYDVNIIIKSATFYDAVLCIYLVELIMYDIDEHQWS